MAKKTQAKTDIDPESKAFFDRICKEYELTVCGKELLRVAVATLARWRLAKETLDREGLVLPGKFARIHPCAKIEHDARLSFCRMMKELSLDNEIGDFQNE